MADTPVGMLLLRADDVALISISFIDDEVVPKGGLAESSNAVLLQAINELRAYFEGELKCFSVPVAPWGTDFQMRVWEELQKIPWGETYSYGDIAKALGDSKASRAVGMANNRNPIPIIIPCHRVVGANGKLVGYAGGLDIKRKLLSLENPQETISL